MEFTKEDALALQGAAVAVDCGFKIRSGPNIPFGCTGKVAGAEKAAKGWRLLVDLEYQGGLTYGTAVHRHSITHFQFSAYMRVLAASPD